MSALAPIAPRKWIPAKGHVRFTPKSRHVRCTLRGSSEAMVMAKTISLEGHRCALWVRSRHVRRKKSCPLYSQERTCAVQLRMSAKGQKRTHAPQQKELLFDHLVGAVLERLRHGDAECLRSPEVDDQLDFRCLLHRKIVGLLSLENPAGVDTDLTGRLCKAAAVAHKAAGDGKLT